MRFDSLAFVERRKLAHRLFAVSLLARFQVIPTVTAQNLGRVIDFAHHPHLGPGILFVRTTTHKLTLSTDSCHQVRVGHFVRSGNDQRGNEIVCFNETQSEEKKIGMPPSYAVIRQTLKPGIAPPTISDKWPLLVNMSVVVGVLSWLTASVMSDPNSVSLIELIIGAMLASTAIAFQTRIETRLLEKHFDHWLGIEPLNNQETH